MARGQLYGIMIISVLAYDLTKFTVSFSNLTLKGYTKGERALRVRGDRARHQDPQDGPGAGELPGTITRLRHMAELAGSGPIIAALGIQPVDPF